LTTVVAAARGCSVAAGALLVACRRSKAVALPAVQGRGMPLPTPTPGGVLSASNGSLLRRQQAGPPPPCICTLDAVVLAFFTARSAASAARCAAALAFSTASFVRAAVFSMLAWGGAWG
jgi:hypothetical protein